MGMHLTSAVDLGPNLKYCDLEPGETFVFTGEPDKVNVNSPCLKLTGGYTYLSSVHPKKRGRAAILPIVPGRAGISVRRIEITGTWCFAQE